MSQLSHKHLVLLHGVSLGKDSECPLSPAPVLCCHPLCARMGPACSPRPQASWCRSTSGTGPWTST